MLPALFLIIEDAVLIPLKGDVIFNVCSPSVSLDLAGLDFPGVLADCDDDVLGVIVDGEDGVVGLGLLGDLVLLLSPLSITFLNMRPPSTEFASSCHLLFVLLQLPFIIFLLVISGSSTFSLPIIALIMGLTVVGIGLLSITVTFWLTLRGLELLVGSFLMTF